MEQKHCVGACLLTIAGSSIVHAMPNAAAATAPPAAGYQEKFMVQTIGTQAMVVDDAVQDVAIPVTVIYPASGTAERLAFGSFALDAVRDAQPAGEGLPMVVISHGKGGSPWTLLNLASAVARGGYVVLLPEHVGNSRSDNSLEGTRANLQNRPRHIKLAIDAVLADPALAAHVDPTRIAAIGHSIGAYSVLAAAGGRPWTGPLERQGQPPHEVEVTHEPRLKALVLLAPAAAWFTPPGALAEIRVPVLIRSGERDHITPTFHADLVKRDVDPGLIEHAVVPNAGHFSFLASFPPAMQSPDFPPSQDPPGFDRDAYQPVLANEIIEFLDRRM